MLFRQLFDPDTSTYSYLLADDDTRRAVLIDPVLERSERDLRLVHELGLQLDWILETHVHADHITGADTMRRATGARVAISARSGARDADRYLHDRDQIRFGEHVLVARATPGHTAGCTTYVLADHTMAFTGDALLIRGCGRTDFQEGDAGTLYASVRDVILALPDHTRLYPAHDYQGRTVSTVVEERRFNPRLGNHQSRADFVELMRGLRLPPPRRLASALPANLRCGILDAATRGTVA